MPPPGLATRPSLLVLHANKSGVKSTPQLFSDPGKKRNPFRGRPFLVGQPQKKEEKGCRRTTETQNPWQRMKGQKTTNTTCIRTYYPLEQLRAQFRHSQARPVSMWMHLFPGHPMFKVLLVVEGCFVALFKKECWPIRFPSTVLENHQGNPIRSQGKGLPCFGVLKNGSL